jgi:hypothetical protein
MSEVATAPGSVSAPAAAPAPASPTPVPAPAAAPAGGGAGRYTQVDSERLAPWKGDYHAALADANRAREYAPYIGALDQFRKAGYSERELQALVEAYLQPDPSGQQRVPPPLDPRQLAQQMKAELLPEIQKANHAAWEERDQKAAAAQQESEYRTALTEQRTSEKTFVADALKNLGVELTGKDGKITPFARSVVNSFYETINEVVKEKTAGLTDQNALRQANDFPSPEVLQEAANRMAWVKNLRYQLASAAANEQAKIGTTLGAGAGGKQPAGKLDPKKDPEGFQRAVMEGVELHPE